MSQFAQLQYYVHRFMENLDSPEPDVLDLKTDVGRIADLWEQFSEVEKENLSMDDSLTCAAATLFEEWKARSVYREVV